MKNLVQEDLRHIWHPCSQLSEYLSGRLPLIPIKSGKGIYLYDFDDNRYVDCISSWWVNIFGHCNETINSCLLNQSSTLEHVLLAGFTHEGVVRLSGRLIALLDSKLSKCFYADNGSSAVEIALKMSFHRNMLSGRRKDTFLKLSNSYHGETIGALSMCGVGIYEEVYRPLLLKSITVVYDAHRDLDSLLDDLNVTLQDHHDVISAFILEPILQCAGGMNIIPKEFVFRACHLARSYGVDIIFDEIATGFGRTGEMFAFMECGFVPDFLCLSKSITGGYLPLSVVVTHDGVYDSFLGDRSNAFLHSHSYTGSALACACANAVLDIFENDDIINKNKIKSSFIESRWRSMEEFVCVANVRCKGMVFAFDLVGVDPIDFYNAALKHSLLLRPLGQTVYFMPPYIISEGEILFVIESLKRALKFLLTRKS